MGWFWDQQRYQRRKEGEAGLGARSWERNCKQAILGRAQERARQGTRSAAASLAAAAPLLQLRQVQVGGLPPAGGQRRHDPAHAGAGVAAEPAHKVGKRPGVGLAERQDWDTGPTLNVPKRRQAACCGGRQGRAAGSMVVWTEAGRLAAQHCTGETGVCLEACWASQPSRTTAAAHAPM